MQFVRIFEESTIFEKVVRSLRNFLTFSSNCQRYFYHSTGPLSSILIKLAGWYENPIKSVVLTFPIKDIVFPTITMCPEDSRPDRWGSVIKIFDQLNTDCGSQR